MKKKRIIAAGVVCALSLTLMIPQVSAFAMSVLSKFRVGEMKTITITIDDIAQMAERAKVEHEKLGDVERDFDKPGDFETEDSKMPEPSKLESKDEFTAFHVNLPRELEAQTPEMYATDVIEKTWETPEGETMTVAMSPSFVAKYEDVVFAATQGIDHTLSEEAKTEMWEKMLASPILTENIRSQLAAIDPNTKDIYLPVVPGISRDADIGGTTGYFYSANDFKQIAASLPAEMGIDQDELEEIEEMDGDDAPKSMQQNVLVWTKNGVLYLLSGDKTDAELTAIARSVR